MYVTLHDREHTTHSPTPRMRPTTTSSSSKPHDKHRHASSSSSHKGKPRLPSLETQLRQDSTNTLPSRKRVVTERNDDDDDDNDDDDKPMPPRKGEADKILRLAREQMREEDDGRILPKKHRMHDVQQQQDDENDSDNDDFSQGDLDDNDEEEEDEVMEQVEITDADETALQAFMLSKGLISGNATSRKTLAEIIAEKLSQQQQQPTTLEVNPTTTTHDDNDNTSPHTDLHPKVIEVYTQVGSLLSRYRSGKVPKAFKMLPALKEWEEVMYLTNPDRWSPQAMRYATKLFASNLNPAMAQRFFVNILLPAVRDDIKENKVLNYHLYMALKKALFKPSAFFKGVLFPLCEAGDCTLREAAIIASVLGRVSIAVAHAGVAIVRVASMPYSGATSIFLTTLLNKKYSLPYKVVDGLVDHFASFMDEKAILPVLWHRSLLVFAQRYKNVITPQQRERLRLLLRAQQHRQITPEVRRELFAVVGGSSTTTPRDVTMMGTEGDDDTIMNE